MTNYIDESLKKGTMICVTEEIANWQLKDIVKLLDFLERSGYKKLYFDGYDAAIYATRNDKN